jgi:hypothetical protein
MTTNTLHREHNNSEELEALLVKTNLLPLYMKDIYLNKIREGKYSQEWVDKLLEVLDHLAHLNHV